MTIEYEPIFFKPHEIESLKPRLVVMLDMARGFSNVPYIITSGYRTKEHNKEVGGVVNSSHLKGEAVDISAIDKKARAVIIYGLIKAGFQRIKIYKTHIHADIDETKIFPYIGIEGE